MQFLEEAKLIQGVEGRGPIISLSDASLWRAHLSDADLHGVYGVTDEELEAQASSLKGATMPNGQKYEEWLKSKGRREDGGSSGPS